jgi:hypothetical protein
VSDAVGCYAVAVAWCGASGFCAVAAWSSDGKVNRGRGAMQAGVAVGVEQVMTGFSRREVRLFSARAFSRGICPLSPAFSGVKSGYFRWAGFFRCGDRLFPVRTSARTCNIPRFYQILGGNFCFCFVVLIEISQGFKTFWFIYKLYYKNYFKLLIFLEELL